MNTYLDTSALLAYYLPEPRSEAFDALISVVDNPVISNLVECEVTAVLGQKVRGGTYYRRDASRALSKFYADIERGAFRYVIIDNGFIRAATKLLESFNIALRTLDALHIAALLQYRCELITGDARMAKTAEQLGVVTHYVPSAFSNQGVNAVDAVIKTLGLSSTLDQKRWGEPRTLESRDLELLRSTRAEGTQLWYHVPTGSVVRVVREQGRYQGNLLR